MDQLLILSANAPDVNYHFLSGQLASSLSFYRASGGARTTAASNIVWDANDQPRFPYDASTRKPLGLLYEPQRTNYIPNSAMSGATVGSPGTLPTGWGSYNQTSGLSRQVTSVGTEYGLPYVDNRFYGTSGATGTYIIFFTGSNVISAVKGETVSVSAYVRMAGGSLSGITSVTASLDEQSGFTYLAGSNGPENTPPSAFVRKINTVVVSNPATDNIKPAIKISIAADVAVDYTLRIYLPQVERGANATSPIMTSGAVATRAADQLSMNIPKGVTMLRLTFDDDSTQDVAVSAGNFTLPSTLNRLHIKRIQSL